MIIGTWYNSSTAYYVVIIGIPGMICTRSLLHGEPQGTSYDVLVCFIYLFYSTYSLAGMCCGHDQCIRRSRSMFNVQCPMFPYERARAIFPSSSFLPKRTANSTDAETEQRPSIRRLTAVLVSRAKIVLLFCRLFSSSCRSCCMSATKKFPNQTSSLLYEYACSEQRYLSRDSTSSIYPEVASYRAHALAVAVSLFHCGHMLVCCVRNVCCTDTTCA